MYVFVNIHIKVNVGMYVYICMHRYDEDNGDISYSCYSGIVRCGGKAASEIIKVADDALSTYLVDAGKMKNYPEKEAISPKVNKISPAVSGRLVLLMFLFAVIIIYYLHISETSSRRSTRLGMCVDSVKTTPVNVGKKTKRIPSASVRTRKEKSDDDEDSIASVDEGYIICIPFKLT